MAKLKSVTVSLPWISGTWEPDESQKRAAWEMYVELVTRISVQPLGVDEGLLREALSSLYVLFGETRRIMRAYGPGVAIPGNEGELSFGAIAVDALNRGLRPVLSLWHPRLLDHENAKSAGTSAVAHERAWSRASELRTVLDELRKQLVQYASLLGDVCGIPSLHE